MTNKHELIDAIAAKMSITKKDSAEVLDSVMQVIADGLVADGVVKLPGVGTLEVRETKERNGRNPQTGEALVIPASKKVSFKVSSSLKAAVRA